MKTLVLKRLAKKFFLSNAYVVKDVDIQIEKGEIIALVGESGSGKTTILRMIAGFETPSYGQIIVNTRTVYDRYTNVNPEKRGVSMVIQDYEFFPHLNVMKILDSVLIKLVRTRLKRESEKCFCSRGCLDLKNTTHMKSPAARCRELHSPGAASNPASSG
jgi:iron(III) transport system ATP-binding protein